MEPSHGAATMQYLASTARKVSIRSGGHFAVIGISEAGAASFFCTHEDGQLTELWQKEELQSWLQLRHQRPQEPEAQTAPGDELAYKIPGLGKLKKCMAALGVTTVSDLAWADDAKIAAISLKVKNKHKFQVAVSDVRTLVGPRPSGAVASGNSAADGASAPASLHSVDRSQQLLDKQPQGDRALPV